MEQVVALLLAAGADYLQPDADGRLASDLAMEYGHTHCVELVQQHQSMQLEAACPGLSKALRHVKNGATQGDTASWGASAGRKKKKNRKLKPAAKETKKTEAAAEASVAASAHPSPAMPEVNTAPPPTAESNLGSSSQCDTSSSAVARGVSGWGVAEVARWVEQSGAFSQTYGRILTVILHINIVPCCCRHATRGSEAVSGPCSGGN